MSYRSYHPERGHIVHMTFKPSAGVELTDPHYALVLTPRLYNAKSGLCVVCPLTSKYKPDRPFLLPVPEGIPQGITGFVICDQLRSIDYRERNMSFVCLAPPGMVEEVLGYVAALLQID